VEKTPATSPMSASRAINVFGVLDAPAVS